MEHKDIRTGFRLKKADQGEVLARIASLNVKDLDGDIIEPGAFGEQRVKVSAFGHQSWQGELPVGTGRVFERRNEALAELKFFMGTTHGADTFATIKGLRELGEWSFGFTVLREGELSAEQRQAGVTRVLKSLEVHEVSPVFRGAGVATQTLSVKCGQCDAKGRRDLERAALALRDAEKTLRGRDPGGDEHRFYSYLGHVLTGCPGRILEPDVKLFDRNELPRTAAYIVPGSAVTFVASDLHGEQLARAILHESKHHGQDDPRSPTAEAQAEAFAAKWAPAVWAAYRQTGGQAHRVRITRNRRPPFTGPHGDGAVVLQRHAGRAWTLNRRNTGNPWMPIA